MKIKYIERSPTVDEMYQGLGIGREIMEVLLKQVDEYKKVNSDIRTYLGVAKDREIFYE